MIIRKHTKSKYRGVGTIPEEVVVMVGRGERQHTISGVLSAIKVELHTTKAL